MGFDRLIRATYFELQLETFLVGQDPSLSSNVLILPDGTVSIEDEASANLGRPAGIVIPSQVSSIGEHAIEGSSVVLVAQSGSYAETWAVEHNMNYRTE